MCVSCVCVHCACMCVFVQRTCVYTCVFASVLLCLVSWCVPTPHTPPHCLSSCTELTLFLVYTTTSMYCPNLWCTAQHAPCAQMSPSIYIWAHSCTLTWFPLPVQMIHTDVTVGTRDRGGRINITAEAQCIKWVERIHSLLTQVV